MTAARWLIMIRHHDGVIKWKCFPRYWPFVRGSHRWLLTSPHKGQWRGALRFSLICIWINDRVNNRGAGDMRRHRGHYDVTVMCGNVLCCGHFSLLPFLSSSEIGFTPHPPTPHPPTPHPTTTHPTHPTPPPTPHPPFPYPLIWYHSLFSMS